jgi:hypothetical protein
MAGPGSDVLRAVKLRGRMERLGNLDGSLLCEPLLP